MAIVLSLAAILAIMLAFVPTVDRWVQRRQPPTDQERVDEALKVLRQLPRRRPAPRDLI